MISWKALIIGLIVTILVGLFAQAIYVLLASYIGMAAVDYAFFSAYKQEIWFIFAILVYCLTMGFGGLLTSTIANDKRVQHAAVVGLLAGLASVVSSASSGELTVMSAVMVGLGGLFASLGGRVAQRIADSEEYSS